MTAKIDFTWKNQLIYPVIVVGSWTVAYFLEKPLILLLGLYFLLFLMLKKQFLLILLAAIASVLVFFRIQYLALPAVPEKEQLTTSALVFCDTIRVNGAYVSFEGQMNGYKTDFTYKVESQSEKKDWQKFSNWHRQLKVTGMFLKKEKRRNQHAFDPQWTAFTHHKLGTFQIDQIKASSPLSVKYFLHESRAQGIDHIRKSFKEKTASYLTALIFGYRDHNFQEIKAIYSGIGLLHLFTISGLHAYLYYGCFSYLLRRLRLTVAGVGALLLPFIFFTIPLFGSTVSVWRAALTYLLTFFIKALHLHISHLDRFAIVVFALIVHDPKLLLQFSGILSLWMTWTMLMTVKKEKNIRQQLLHSHYLNLLVAPILMYFFFEIPLLGGLFTFLMLPFFKKVFLPLALVSFVASFSHLEIGLFDQIILLLENFLNFFDRTVLITGQPALLLVVLVLIINTFIYHYGKKPILFIPLICLIFWQNIAAESSLAFVDVGQGDSIVIQKGIAKEVYVIDTGGKMTFHQEEWQNYQAGPNAEYTLIPYLKGEGIRKIDGLLLTHGDTDHMGDAKELFKNFEIKRLYVGKGSLKHNNMKRLLKDIPKKTEIIEVSQGNQIGEKIQLNILAPQEEGKGKNEDSVVVAAKIHEINFLLTGDLDQAGERKLLKNDPQLKCDVLKLGHHGSRTSSDEVFIQTLKPKHAIVSCGKDNRFGHPHKEVMDTLNKNQVQVLRTDQQGMIRYSWHFFDSDTRLTFEKED